MTFYTYRGSFQPLPWVESYALLRNGLSCVDSLALPRDSLNSFSVQLNVQGASYWWQNVLTVLGGFCQAQQAAIIDEGGRFLLLQNLPIPPFEFTSQGDTVTLNLAPDQATGQIAAWSSLNSQSGLRLPRRYLFPASFSDTFLAASCMVVGLGNGSEGKFSPGTNIESDIRTRPDVDDLMIWNSIKPTALPFPLREGDETSNLLWTNEPVPSAFELKAALTA